MKKMVAFFIICIMFMAPSTGSTVLARPGSNNSNYQQQQQQQQAQQEQQRQENERRQQARRRQQPTQQRQHQQQAQQPQRQPQQQPKRQPQRQPQQSHPNNRNSHNEYNRHQNRGSHVHRNIFGEIVAALVFIATIPDNAAIIYQGDSAAYNTAFLTVALESNQFSDIEFTDGSFERIFWEDDRFERTDDGLYLIIPNVIRFTTYQFN